MARRMTSAAPKTPPRAAGTYDPVEPAAPLTRNPIKNAAARAQLQRIRPERWNETKMQVFLEHLAVTANVSFSLEQVGMSSAGLYKLRKRVAAFRTAWDTALEEGYARLEAQLLDHALNGKRTLVERDGAPVEEIEAVTDGTALNILRQHRQQVAAYRAAAANRIDDPDRILARMTARIERIARARGLA